MGKYKKIQALMPLYHPHVGGMEMNSRQTYKHLAELGWEVRVITPHVPVEGPVPPPQEHLDGTTVSRIPKWIYGYNPFALGIQYLKSEIIVLHHFHLNPGLLIAIISLVLKWIGLKRNTIILSAHGYFSSAPEAIPQSPKFKVIYWIEKHIGLPILLQVVDGVRAVSSVEKEALVQRGFPAEKITVIGNGLDSLAFDPAIGFKASGATISQTLSLDPYVLLLSRIDRVKNIDTVLRAVPLTETPVLFVVAGNIASDGYEYHQSLLDLVDELGIRSRVTFLGPVSGYDKFYLMRRATVFVQMSISEGFGNAVFEAMSQGCVCVVSAGNAMEDIVTHDVNGFVHGVYDYGSLARTIDFIVKNQYTPKIQTMKKEAVNRTLGRTWKDVAVEIERFYLGLSQYT